jgi:hypothetical protein
MRRVRPAPARAGLTRQKHTGHMSRQTYRTILRTPDSALAACVAHLQSLDFHYWQGSTRKTHCLPE